MTDICAHMYVGYIPVSYLHDVSKFTFVLMAEKAQFLYE